MFKRRVCIAFFIASLLCGLLSCGNAEGEKGSSTIEYASSEAEEDLIEKSGPVSGSNSESGPGFDMMSGDNEDTEWIMLSDKVKIARKVLVPDEQWQRSKLIRAKLISFDGGELLPQLLSVDMVPESVAVSEDELSRHWSYAGNLGDKWNDLDGEMVVSDFLLVRTNHWCSMFQGQAEMGYEKARYTEDVELQELSFCAVDEAEAEVLRFLESELGLSGVLVDAVYSFTGTELEAMAEYNRNNTLKPAEYAQDLPYDFKDEEGCYWIRLSDSFEGLPLLDHVVSRQDDAYIPRTVIHVGFSKNGIEYLQLMNRFRSMEEHELVLLPLEDIYASLCEKFERSVWSNVMLTDLRLLYYPLPVNAAEGTDLVYEMIPAWECRVERGEDSFYVYINAADGMEILG